MGRNDRAGICGVWAVGAVVCAAFWAAALFAAVSLQPAFDTNSPNSEAFINLFLAIGLAFWVRDGMVAATLLNLFRNRDVVQQVAIAPIVLIAIVDVVARRRIRRATIPGDHASCVARRGRVFRDERCFGIFYRTNFVFARYYSGNVAMNACFMRWRPAGSFRGRASRSCR